MLENKRFRVNIQGDQEATTVELHIPTRWLWVFCAVLLAASAPDIWNLIRDIGQSWPLQ